jgi:hypothetical protein
MFCAVLLLSKLRRLISKNLHLGSVPRGLCRGRHAYVFEFIIGQRPLQGLGVIERNFVVGERVLDSTGGGKWKFLPPSLLRSPD